MNYNELREKMLKDLSGEYRKSIEGMIDCYEKLGKTVDEAMKELAQMLDKD